MKQLTYIGIFILTACGTAKNSNPEENRDNIFVPVETPMEGASDVISVSKIENWDNELKLTEAMLNGSSSETLTLENENFMDCPNDGGCSLTGFYFNGEILKTTTWFGFSNGYQEIHYFYQQGKLKLVNELRFSWIYDAEKDSFDYSKTETNFDGKYYFDNDSLFHTITTGHNRFENEELDPQTILLKEAYDYINILNNAK